MALSPIIELPRHRVLQQRHDVITWPDFMESVAPRIWPEDER